MSIRILWGRNLVKERVNEMQLIGEDTESLKMKATHSFENIGSHTLAQRHISELR